MSERADPERAPQTSSVERGASAGGAGVPGKQTLSAQWGTGGAGAPAIARAGAPSSGPGRGTHSQDASRASVVQLLAGNAAAVVPGSAIDAIRRLSDATRSDVAWAYLNAHEDKFIAAIRKRLGTAHPPTHERVAWLPSGLVTGFSDALYASLGSDRLFSQLPELLHPVDPWYVIDQHRVLDDGMPGVVVNGREPKGPLMAWSSLAGDALAIEAVVRLHESLIRMLPRYEAQLDARQPAPVAVGDLVASHPIDRVTARLLCDDRVARPVAAKRGSRPKPTPDASTFREGVRFLQDYRWLGSTDRSLWNWIEVKIPRDATAEDLAATLWLDPDASHRAYGITASPPFFRIEPSWARAFDAAKQYAPEGVDQPHGDNGLALASSAFATDAAIAQASSERKFDKRGIPLPADLDTLSKALRRSHRQLERVKRLLGPLKLWELVVPAAHWVASHREHLLSIPDHRLLALAPVIAGQQEILYEAVGAITKLLDAVGPAAGVDGDHGAAMTVLRHYATAIGESHLLHTARAQLARAHAAEGELSLALLERSALNTQAAVGELRANETRMSWGGDAAAADVAATRRRILELRGRQAAGQEIGGAEIALAAAELKDQSIEVRAKSWYFNLHNLSEEAREASFGFYETAAGVAGELGRPIADVGTLKKQAAGDQALADAFGTSFLGLPSVLVELIGELHQTVIQKHTTHRAELLRQVDPRDLAARAQALQVASSATEARLARFVADHKLSEKFGAWIALIDQQRTRTAVIQIATNIAVLIGASVVGGLAGNMVSGAVRGTLLAEAAEATVGMLWATRVANATGIVAGLATDAAINATAQVVMSGGSFGDAFVDNFIASGALRVVLAPLHRVVAAYGGIEKDVANLNLWERSLRTGKTVLRAGAALTVETVTGAAVYYVAHRMRLGDRPDERTAMQWAIEGGSMAVGKYVGQWLHGFEARLVQLAEHGAHLRARARDMHKLEKRVADAPDKDAAMEMLLERHTLLDEEERTVGELLKQGKISAQTADTLLRGNHHEQAEVKDAAFATMPLRLAGLTPDDSSGKVWSGTTEGVAIALHQAHRAGLTVDVLDHDVAGHEWKIRYNGRELTIVETGPAEHAAAATTRDSRQAGRYAAATAFLATRRPARTPYGEVWPGDIPAHAPADKRAVFEQAKALYDGLKDDGFQGGGIGRVRWAELLVRNGIPVEGVTVGGSHPVYEPASPQREIAPSDRALPRDPSLGARSKNTGYITQQKCLTALRELAARGGMLHGARIDGSTITVELPGGRKWRIEVVAPRPTSHDDMAALLHGRDGDTVWVSDTLTDDQVTRALGAIIGDSLTATGHHSADSGRFGELDAMFAHREAVAGAERPQPPARATPAEIKAHAAAASRAESTVRIDAEIDVALLRLGVLEPGPAREAKLAEMPPRLADRVRGRLAQPTIGFRADGTIAEAAVARPGEAPKSPLGISEVIPEAPSHVHAYGEADRARVMELRVELETIAEIDARIALRDQPGTNRGGDIAKGETRRRAGHVARARELMAELQLGGDKSYMDSRLKELAAVFPGVERDMVPAIHDRIARRETARGVHEAAAAFRAERAKQQAEATRTVLGGKPFKTKRLVVGDGFSGLADVATLGVRKHGDWLDPRELLVVGGPDLVARMGEFDPSVRWGQREGAYDRGTDAHPAFSNADGRGTGDLRRAVEDPGEFMHVGELRDAMDLARKRLGIVAVDGETRTVETPQDKRPDSPPWEVDANEFPVRAKVVIDQAEVYIYAERADITSGPGKPRMPNDQILSPADRKLLLDRGTLFSGEKVLEGASVEGKRVLVMAFGATGGWIAVTAAKRGAARVDFAGAAGGEVGTRPSNPRSHEEMGQIDRLQDALDGSANIHVTMDRIMRIEPKGEGAIVTYVHGHGESAEVYDVEYDVIATTMGYSTADAKTQIPGAAPTVKEMIGNMKMVPHRGSQAPVLEDAGTGRVRVTGYAAGDAVNVSDNAPKGGMSERHVLSQRHTDVTVRTSADSPDDRVVEGVGTATRLANKADEGGDP